MNYIMKYSLFFLKPKIGIHVILEHYLNEIESI